MDNAPAHPQSLKDHLLDEFKFIEVRFLPPNTTPLLQPMDQQVISNFKKIYIKELFQRCFELTEETNLTLREFWQNHFNIVHCLKIIDKAWNGVSQRTLVSAWTKLWPHIVHAYDFKGLSGEQEPPIIDVIVSLGKTLGLEVNEPIIQELVEEENQELTTNELIDLHREQHQEVKEVISSGEEEDENSLGSLPSDQIREICKMWETVQLFVAKHHPNKPAALRATDQFNDNAICCCLPNCHQRKYEVASVVDDNCCNCNYAALRKMCRLHNIELVYATYHVEIGETPFFVALDHEKRTVVVSIRGTLSLQDVITDLNAEADQLPTTTLHEDWLGHKGMVQVAEYIRRKLIDNHILSRAFNYCPRKTLKEKVWRDHVTLSRVRRKELPATDWCLNKDLVCNIEYVYRRKELPATDWCLNKDLVCNVEYVYRRMELPATDWCLNKDLVCNVEYVYRRMELPATDWCLNKDLVCNVEYVYRRKELPATDWCLNKDLVCNVEYVYRRKELPATDWCLNKDLVCNVEYVYRRKELPATDWCLNKDLVCNVEYVYRRKELPATNWCLNKDLVCNVEYVYRRKELPATDWCLNKDLVCNVEYVYRRKELPATDWCLNKDLVCNVEYVYRRKELPATDWCLNKDLVCNVEYVYRRKELPATDWCLNKDLVCNVEYEKGTTSYGLVLVGHSLGAGAAAILAIFLRPDYPSLVCYAYSPPGGLLSLNAAEYTKSFITSVVLGKDVVPRIGLHQMEALRMDLINAIKRSRDPKQKLCRLATCEDMLEMTRTDPEWKDKIITGDETWVYGYDPETKRQSAEWRGQVHVVQAMMINMWKVILGCCGREAGFDLTDLVVERRGDVTTHPSDASIALTVHQPLYPPGRIIHIVRSHPGPCRSRKKFEPVYQAVWANTIDFDEVLISPVMIQDHMPDKVLEALEKLLQNTDRPMSERGLLSPSEDTLNSETRVEVETNFGGGWDYTTGTPIPPNSAAPLASPEDSDKGHLANGSRTSWGGEVPRDTSSCSLLGNCYPQAIVVETPCIPHDYPQMEEEPIEYSTQQEYGGQLYSIYQGTSEFSSQPSTSPDTRTLSPTDLSITKKPFTESSL
ncbi:PARVA [Cordylochernes scorpioides]|uniref:sn-1-specific diacylglycerol lipase n=1 Tax=Cordylochernes scorpioides TaxID=51811 RepID=A0ABY6KEQ5_9ARAC|nr:PARVA [Cordylochernes scorpioides]